MILYHKIYSGFAKPKEIQTSCSSIFHFTQL